MRTHDLTTYAHRRAARCPPLDQTPRRPALRAASQIAAQTSCVLARNDAEAAPALWDGNYLLTIAARGLRGPTARHAGGVFPYR
jgi:hypothetical protein